MQRWSINISRVNRWVVDVTLLLLLACYANITLFSHAHVVDGVVMVHSHIHPLNHATDATQSHHGSAREVEFINAIGHFVVEAQSLFSSLVAVAINTLPRIPRCITALAIITAACCALPLLRAPPMARIA